MLNYWKNELVRINYPNIEKILEIGEKLEECIEKQIHFSMDTDGLTQEDIFVIKRLERFKPLSPLTLDEKEWMKITNDGVFQSTRQSNVFRDKKGVYILNGIIAKDRKGENTKIVIDGVEYKDRVYTKDLAVTDTFYIDIEDLDREKLKNILNYYELIVEEA